MAICNGCGGVVGRDCFNPPECEWISEDMRRREWESAARSEATLMREETARVLRVLLDLTDAAKKVRPFVQDEADLYVDDGSNEPLEALRALDAAIETAEALR